MLHVIGQKFDPTVIGNVIKGIPKINGLFGYDVLFDGQWARVFTDSGYKYRIQIPGFDIRFNDGWDDFMEKMRKEMVDDYWDTEFSVHDSRSDPLLEIFVYYLFLVGSDGKMHYNNLNTILEPCGYTCLKSQYNGAYFPWINGEEINFEDLFLDISKRKEQSFWDSIKSSSPF